MFDKYYMRIRAYVIDAYKPRSSGDRATPFGTQYQMLSHSRHQWMDSGRAHLSIDCTNTSVGG